MPSIITHTAMADSVYKSLDKTLQNKVDYDLLKVFSQSFDMFFFYNVLDFKNRDRILSFGHRCHANSTSDYLINIVKNIKELHLENNKKALAYLYGSINHYTMDSICHKFVYYKAGAYDKDEIDTYKYRGKHTYVEKQLDAYYSLVLFKKPMYKVNIYNNILKNAKFDKEVINLMNKTFYDTYEKENMGNYFYKGFKSSKYAFILAFNDRYGIKKQIFKLFDHFKKKGTPLEYYSLYIKEPDINCLNIQKKSWSHPCNNKIKYKDSFIDLFNESIDESLNIINKVNDVLYNDKDINSLKKVIPNISYRTGFDLDNNKPLKYFEY